MPENSEMCTAMLQIEWPIRKIGNGYLLHQVEHMAIQCATEHTLPQKDKL